MNQVINCILKTQANLFQQVIFALMLLVQDSIQCVVNKLYVIMQNISLGGILCLCNND